MWEEEGIGEISEPWWFRIISLGIRIWDWKRDEWTQRLRFHTACWSQNRDQEFESLIKHPPYALWKDERPRPWKAEETTRQLKQNEWINEWMKSNFWFCQSLYYLFCFIVCSSCLHYFLPLLLGFILFFSNLFELTFGLLIFTFFKVCISISVLHNLIPWVLMSFSSTQFQLSHLVVFCL